MQGTVGGGRGRVRQKKKRWADNIKEGRAAVEFAKHPEDCREQEQMGRRELVAKSSVSGALTTLTGHGKSEK